MNIFVKGIDRSVKIKTQPLDVEYHRVVALFPIIMLGIIPYSRDSLGSQEISRMPSA